MHVDADCCGGFGQCVQKCPEVFALVDDGYAVVLLPDVPVELESAVADAEQALPDARHHGFVTDAVERFRVHVDDAVLDDLQQRLARTRFPDEIAGTGWEYGTPIDVRAGAGGVLARRVRLAGPRGAAQPARAVRHHASTASRSTSSTPDPSGADALPLLLVHGWPGSIVEFLDVIPRLTDPVAHGGRPDDAFHVIAPSLPGYALLRTAAHARDGTSAGSRRRSSS